MPVRVCRVRATLTTDTGDLRVAEAHADLASPGIHRALSRDRARRFDLVGYRDGSSIVRR